MVRKNGLGLLAVLSIVVLIIMAVFSDFLLERTMERIGGAIVGARVEFNRVDLHIFRATLSWDRLQVANPDNTWRNLFETGFTKLDMRLEPLFYKRFIAEDMRIDSLLFNTSRTTSGALPGRPATRSTNYIDSVKARFERKLQELPLYNVARLSELDIDGIMDAAGLKTKQRIGSLVDSVERKRGQWEEKLGELPDQEEMARIERQIDSIDIERLDDPEEIARATRLINQILRRIDSLQAVVDSAEKELQGAISEARGYKALAERTIREDYERLLNIARLPEITPGIIAEVLFSPTVVERIHAALTYIGIFRSYNERLRKAGPEKDPNPPRLQGQDIGFPDRRRLPLFWIQRGSLSTVVQGIRVKGLVRNIVTAQRIIGLPTTIEASGTRQDGASVVLRGLFDYLQALPRERLGMEVKNVSLDGFEFNAPTFLPSKLLSGIGRFGGEVEMAGLRFAANGKFSGTGLRFDLSMPDSEDIGRAMAGVRRSIARSTDNFGFEAFTEMLRERFSFSMTSNISEVALNAIKQTAFDEIEKARKQLRDRVEREAGGKLDELRKLIEKQAGDAKKTLSRNKENLDNLSREAETMRRKLIERLQELGRKRTLERLDRF